MLYSLISLGFEIKNLIPRKIKNKPPPILIQTDWLIRIDARKVSPKAAIAPNNASAVAAPSPVTNPDQRPLTSVRLMHKIPIGPTGAAIEKPIKILWRKIGIFILWEVGNDVVHMHY